MSKDKPRATGAPKIPAKNVAQYIADLARQHGISGKRTPDDALAEVITRLADDEVVNDATEDILVALKRAGVIDGSTMVSLLGKYLDEKL